MRNNLYVAERTYDFGPDDFMRILKFENGRFVEIETRGRGFFQE